MLNSLHALSYDIFIVILRHLKELKLSLDIYHEAFLPLAENLLPGYFFTNLFSLEKLYVYGIPLRGLPEEFQNLVNLRQIYCEKWLHRFSIQTVL